MTESIADIRPSGPLVGRLVRVEPLQERHREGLREAAAEDPGIFRYMTWPGDFDRWFEEALTAPAEVPFAVVGPSGEAGSTRYLAYAPEHRRVEIGWTWLRPSTHRSGANVEAKMLLLEHAFERCGVQRVEFKTDANNERARAALAAIPARFEGIHRKHMLVRGDVRRDSAWYAVIDDEWPEVKQTLEQRLARSYAPK